MPNWHRRLGNHIANRFRRDPITLVFYADTDYTGTVAETEAKRRYRHKKPGAILMTNCDGAFPAAAAEPNRDLDDDDIIATENLPDFAKVLVKRKNLPAGYTAYMEMSDQDARKVLGFEGNGAGAPVVIGYLAAGVVTRYQLTNLAAADCEFLFEAVKPVWRSGDETVKLNFYIEHNGNKVFKDYLYLTIAPWLMTSNLEHPTDVFAADIGALNAAFRTDLDHALPAAVNLNVLTDPAGNIEQWCQDVVEVGVSNKPHAAGTHIMHQFINSPNAATPGTRIGLYDSFRRQVCAPGFGHIPVPAGAFHNLDSFGNLEVSPPLEKYPFGRIYYGIRDTGFSAAHSGDEMDQVVIDLLNANKYQAPVEIPTNWLTVGHVDEFMSFVPDNRAAADMPYKLLLASPQLAIDICRRCHRTNPARGMIICRTKGGGYQMDIEDFFGGRQHLLRKNKAIQKLIDKIVRRIIKPEFKLSYSNGGIIRIPVIFNADMVYTNGTVEGAIARTGGMVNCLVAGTTVIIPKPYGPKLPVPKVYPAHALDEFEEDVYNKLGPPGLGLTVRFVDDWDAYHVLQGEIHCGTNAKRAAPNWQWWNRNLKIGGSKVHK